MNKKEISLIILISIIIFLIVYSPHFSYPFPFFIDEWHHLTQSSNLGTRYYESGISGIEIGFHIFLRVLNSFTNLILIYKFLPALWAVFSALTLFYIVEKKTNNFYVGILSMIFFMSIKSNIDLGGLWFFTPLTFSIPFVFLYIYFFTEGIEKQNNKMILCSLGIMIFLLPIHVISILFIIPILLVYCLFHLKYIKSEWKFFSWFLILPIIGILFYLQITKNSLFNLFSAIQFKLGFGYADLSFSFFDVYSVIGFVLALLGIVFIMLYKKDLKRYSIFIIWPLYLLVSITFFKIFGVSLFSPYQRNIYYFVLGLPVLSSFGVIYLLRFIKSLRLNQFSIKLLSLILILIILFLTFYQYYNLPERAELRKIIDEDDYKDLLYLKNLDGKKVLAEPLISNALAPVSEKVPVTTSFISSNRKEVEEFFGSSYCEKKIDIIESESVDYVLSKKEIDCGWELIYEGKNFIYEV